MKDINKVILEGNIGSDVASRLFNETSKLLSFSLATSKRWQDKSSGEKKEKTTWHKIVLFDQDLVEKIESSLSKGVRVCISGELHKREWMVENEKKSIVEVIAKEIEVVANSKIEEKDESQIVKSQIPNNVEQNVSDMNVSNNIHTQPTI